MSYTFSLSRRSLPVRCLCLLLAVLVLWCFFMVPRAGAVATEAATVAYAGALIGTILVGAGVVFSSHGDMQAVGAAMYKSWIKSSNAIGSTISAIASWALQHGEAVAKGALRVGKDMYQAVVGTYNTYCMDSADYSCTVVKSMSARDLIDAFWGTDVLYARTSKRYVKLWYSRPASTIYVYGQDLKTGKLFSTSWDSRYGGRVGFVFEKSSDSMSFGVGHFIDGDSSYYVGRLDPMSWTENGSTFTLDTYYGYKVSTSPIPETGDLVYPSDDYLVKMPDIPSVDTVTGTVTFPSDAAYTKDAVSVPYPVDAEGVKVPDIPYDKVVDQSTGKTLDDADTGTDTKPGEGTGEGTETGSGVSGLIGTIIGLLKNFFDSPSDFKLDMDGFRNLAIADKFPFCIPFDMVDSVKQFAATAADYQFRIKFDTQYFSVDHTVDLTPIAVPLAFFRYIVCVWFVWVLMSRTHDLMKW